MITWKRLLLACGSLFLLALTFTTLFLPGIISEHARSWVAKETGRVLEVEDISINPFSLSVEIRNLRLRDRDSTPPLVAWSLLRLSLSFASLYHRAPIIDELRLDSPALYLERLTQDRFNFSDLLPVRGGESGNETTDEPVRFSINNLSFNDGRIDLVDSSLEHAVHHTVRNLQLVLPSIGNLPYMVEHPAQPLFRAEINDSAINLKGQLKPFSNVQEMQLDLSLDSIDLPFYLGYVPVKLPVEVRSGKLSLDLAILYRISAENGGDLELRGKVNLASLNIRDALQEQLFFLPLMQVDIAPSRPLMQDIHLSALRVYNLEVQLKRDPQGAWNHARMATSKQAVPAEEQQVATPSTFQLSVDAIEIRDGVLFFEDQLPPGGFRTVAREINIDVDNFALDTAEDIPLGLAFKTDRDEAVTINGHFRLDPFTLALQSELHNIPLGAYEPYYHDISSEPFGGTLDVQTTLLVNPEQPLFISDGTLAIHEFSAAFNDNDGFELDRFDIGGLTFDLAQNRLAIETVNAQEARIRFSRNKAGKWSFLSPNFPILSASKDASIPGPSAQTAAKDSAFSYHIGHLSVSNAAIDFKDDRPPQGAHLQANNLNLALKNLAAPEKVHTPLTFNVELPPGGRVDISGELILAEQRASLKHTLKNIPLKPLAPYLAEQTNLVLTQGYLNAILNTEISAAPAPFTMHYNGNLGVNRMHILDGTHHEDLIKWDSLQVAGIKGDLVPPTLTLGSITLSDYYAKVLIDEDARLNLAEAMHNKSTDGDTKDAAEPATETEAVQETASVETPDIRIEKVVLQGGQVDFSDRNLPQPFHADMRELGGRIEGLDSSTEARAEVDLRGSLRNQSPLSITGTINPLAKKLFLDLELSFRDIEMSPFSPYSGNFVGYLIEKGKLNLALDYKIEDNQLKASNKVFLDQFNFGAAVESEEAIGLPVKLAVALLKDGQGEIHLDIPVSGSLDDPQFSITGVVWRVIKNLLVRAATSPLALLGTLVGGGEEDFSTVSFAYGSARLSQAEMDKLRKMSHALADRPGLEIEVSGFIDPENDAEGYRKEQLAVQIKRLRYLDLIKAETLPEGAKEEDMTIPAEEYADYLWRAYREADFPKPRNFIGMTKKLPEPEMEKLIYTNTQVTQEHLEELAQRRALAVQNFMIEEGQLTQERLFLKKPNITAPPDEKTGTRARVELGAVVR